MKMNFHDFKNRVRAKGGIWASDAVYFSQFRDGYSASYKPSFPEHSPEDRAISYNRVTETWREIVPEQYDTEYKAV